ncbi:Uncharacterised protein [Mycobacterium tuberculosis]|nr:Uncharacterised protein [Mycobacterium tuberculosis]
MTAGIGRTPDSALPIAALPLCSADAVVRYGAAAATPSDTSEGTARVPEASEAAPVARSSGPVSVCLIGPTGLTVLGIGKPAGSGSPVPPAGTPPAITGGLPVPPTAPAVPVPTSECPSSACGGEFSALIKLCAAFAASAARY